MSKVVTIPKDRNPFIVIVNGVKYSYQAGQEVDVPDAVADVIEKYENAKPKPDPNAGGGSASVIEPITITENGTYEAPNSVDGYNPIMVNVGGTSSEEWIGDGNTHIWITLQEGRTSPMLGVCPKGTVTVDWGDGTEPDVLTGTSTTTVKWTPNHEYAEPGDYVITLTVDGSMGFTGSPTTNQYSCLLRYSSDADGRNRTYQNTVQKIEMGSGVTSIGSSAFIYCYSLTSIVIPDGVTSIGSNAFSGCYSLTSIVIPDGVTSIGSNAFQYCYSLTSIVIPDSVTSIDINTFDGCFGIRYYDFTNRTAVPKLVSANAFNGVSADCEIRVPAALYDEWIAATNWASYASRIVAV